MILGIAEISTITETEKTARVYTMNVQTLGSLLTLSRLNYTLEAKDWKMFPGKSDQFKKEDKLMILVPGGLH